MKKGLMWLFVLVAAFVTLVGCGGRTDFVDQQVGSNLPACTATMHCECDSPRTPCWDPQLETVLVCDQGVIVNIENVGDFTNPACQPKADAALDSTVDAGNDAVAETDAGQDAQAEADAQVETGSDAGNNADAAPIPDAAAKPLLTITFLGPQSSMLYPGQKTAPFLTASFCASENLEIKRLDYELGNGTGNLFDPSDKPYFTNIKLVNAANGTTVMGPKELAAGVIFPSQTLSFTDTFQLDKDTCKIVSLVADLAPDFSFCTGCTWRATLKPPSYPFNGLVTFQGQPLTSDLISPTTNVVGNLMTMSASNDGGTDAGTLAIQLADSPVSSMIVKKTLNAEAVGIKVTGAAQTMTLQSLTLKAQAKIAGANCNFGEQCAYEAAATRITSMCLFDGDTQVGSCKAPDTNTGMATIDGINAAIKPGETKTYTVKVTLASVASLDKPYDQIAIGIMQPWDAIVVNAANESILADIQDSIRNQTGATPTVIQTIVNSGTLSIEADSHPASTIVVAGKDYWIPFASYKATALYEEITMDRVSVLLSASKPFTYDTDNADFAVIAVASNGTVRGSDIPPMGTSLNKDIDLSGNQINVPKDGSVIFQLWAKLADVQSHSANPATSGVARSGHMPSLGISSGLTTGEWNANYAGKLNVRATGSSSGERAYAAAGAAAGNPMLVRKTKPIIAPQNLANSVLVNAEVGLCRFQLGANSAGSVAFKQIAFAIGKSTEVSLANFRFYRGSTLIPPAEYHVIDIKNGTDLYAGATEIGSSFALVNVSFTTEDYVSGSGNVYELRATVTNASSGMNVATSLIGTNPIVVTGTPVPNLMTMPQIVASPWIFHVSNGVNVYSGGPFIWSDQSEVPHSDTSADWTNGYLVEDMTKVATLSN